MKNTTTTDFSKFIESHADFPKPDVVYRDFTPLLADPAAFRAAIFEIANQFKDCELTKIAAIEAKGFTLGAALAFHLELPLVLIRKPELVPGDVDRVQFIKEYGHGEYQVKKGQFLPEDKVLLIYDIMAGPGATRAGINLIERSGATTSGCAFVIELEYLGGREELTHTLKPDTKIYSLVKIASKPMTT